MGDQETDIQGGKKVIARAQLENIPRSNRFLIIGGILTGVSGFILWILGLVFRTDRATGMETGDTVPEFVESMVNRSLLIDIGLWTIFITGITLMIYGLKMRFPNPEDIEFEEEWERKGR